MSNSAHKRDRRLWTIDFANGPRDDPWIQSRYDDAYENWRTKDGKPWPDSNAAQAAFNAGYILGRSERMKGMNQ